MPGPDPAFWQQRFDTGQLAWDRGAPSPQLARWLADGTLVPGRIAVPGCGTGHEAVALARAGFAVTAIDYTPGAIAATQRRLADAHLQAEVRQADVLAWQPAQPLDAVYEQTCLCALHPDHWVAYAEQLQRWLRPGGRLALLAMQCLRDGARTGLIEGPPYHVDINALRALFPIERWDWPAPPYVQVPHPANGWFELALSLRRRPAG
jgi:SAM-dependent methyltransferase